MAEDPDVARDADQLAKLKYEAANDPRTIPEMKAADTSWSQGTITGVSRYDDGTHWTIEWKDTHEADPTTGEPVESAFAGSMGVGMPIIEGKPEPKVGDTFRCYGRFGQEVYGMDLNGEEIYYRTPWERFARRMEMLAEHDRENRETFAKERELMDAAYEALPPALKMRIDRLRAKSPTFRMNSEGYEMAAVGDAPKIARALAEENGWEVDENFTAAGVEEKVIKAVVEAFDKASVEAQRERVPDMIQGHSGNTWGHAVHFAYGLLTGELPRYEAGEREGVPA